MAGIQRNVRLLVDRMRDIDTSVGALANHALMDGTAAVARTAVRSTMNTGSAAQVLVDSAGAILENIRPVERLPPRQELQPPRGQPAAGPGHPAEAAACPATVTGGAGVHRRRATHHPAGTGAAAWTRTTSRSSRGTRKSPRSPIGRCGRRSANGQTRRISSCAGHRAAASAAAAGS